MTNRTFTRTVLSTVATVGLVASALVGVLSAGLPAYANGTTTAATNPAPGATVSTGTPFQFTFTARNTSGATATIGVGITDNTAGILSTQSCRLTVTPQKTLSSTSCAALFDGTLRINNVNNNETVTITVSEVATSAIPNDTDNEVTFEIYSDANPAAGDVRTVATADRTTVQYNAQYGRSLTIRKEKVDDARYGGTLPAAPNSDVNFAITIDNTAGVEYTNVELNDALDSVIESFFTSCDLSDAGVVGVTDYTSGATITGGIGTTDLDITIPTIAASTGPNVPTRIAFYIGCDRDATAGAIPDGTQGYNVVQIEDFDGADDSVYNLPADLRARALVSGSGNLVVTKTAVSQSTPELRSGSVVTYRVNVTNNSNRPSDAAQLIDVIQAPAGITVTTSAAPVGNTQNPFVEGSNTVNVATQTDIDAAFPASTNIANTARVIPLGRIRAGQSFQFDYTVTYAGTFPTLCQLDEPAPIIRNTALVANPQSATPVAQGDAVTGTNNITVGATAGFLVYDVLAEPSTVTLIADQVYQDTMTSDNIDFVDNTPNVCESDMAVLSKRIVPENATSVKLGQEVTYSITYANLAANTIVLAPAVPEPRSEATDIVITDTLPTGATFVSLVSPAGATATVNGNVVTITGLPDIMLGDDGAKEVQLRVKMPTDKTLVDTDVTNVATVSAENEAPEFVCEDPEGFVLTDICDPGNGVVGNNASQHVAVLRGGPDIEVMKTVDIGEGQLNSNVSELNYTIKVKNIGTEMADEVMIRDIIDRCTTFVSQSSGPQGMLNTDSTVINFMLGDMNANAEQTIMFKVRIKDECKNQELIQNSATAIYSNQADDLNANNDTGIAISSVKKLSNEATLMKTVDRQNAQAGDTLTYTLTVKAGPNGYRGNLVDELPEGVTFKSATPEVSRRDGRRLIWDNITLAANQELKATVVVTINAGSPSSLVNKLMSTDMDGNMLAPAQAVTNVDSAKNSKIEGFVYIDVNPKNGKCDEKENNADMYGDYLGNIRLMAMNESTQMKYETTTDRSGNFKFENLPAGMYVVTADSNSVKATYMNQMLNITDTDSEKDGKLKVNLPPSSTVSFGLPPNVSRPSDKCGAFVLSHNSHTAGASSLSNPTTSVAALVAVLSFSFLATLAYSEIRDRAFSK